MGIGHVRRNLLLAEAFAGEPCHASVLLAAGARQAGALAAPPGVDCLTLPALHKEPDGHYRARDLDVPLAELVGLRSRCLAEALDVFAPDLLVVDKVPRGALGELDRALRRLRRCGRTRCVLGLRDVLDEPAAVRREWAEAGNEAAVRDFYDAVWVYGDPAVYDPVREYGFGPEVAAKVRFAGYLDQARRSRPAEGAGGGLPAEVAGVAGPVALCLLGGGQDGAPLAEAFLAAALAPGVTGVVVAGPFMPAGAWQRLARRAAADPRFRALRFAADPAALMARADRVVAMGGYNTVCDVLSFGKPALIVPRVRPRREQLIRAERLRALGLVDVLHPDALSPEALAGWLARPPAADPAGARARVRFDGLDRLPRLAAEALAAPRRAAPTHPDRRMSHAAR
jgi:predicted glycosyltransferase